MLAFFTCDYTISIFFFLSLGQALVWTWLYFLIDTHVTKFHDAGRLSGEALEHLWLDSIIDHH